MIPITTKRTVPRLLKNPPSAGPTLIRVMSARFAKEQRPAEIFP
jgi:hypothetical protein